MARATGDADFINSWKTEKANERKSNNDF